MRSWIGSQSALGAPVTIVKLRKIEPSAGFFQRYHSPARAKTPPPACMLSAGAIV